MNCEEFTSGLEACVESRTLPALALQQHGEACPVANCREVWSDFVLLESALTSWKSMRAVQSVEAGRPAVLRFRFSESFRLALSSGAVLAVASLLLMVSLRTGQSAAEMSASQKPMPSLTRFSTTVATSAVQKKSLSEAQLQSAPQNAFSIDWIAEAPLQVTSSMAYVLLGNAEPAPEATGSPKWLEGWPEQVLPIEDNFEVIRGLLIERQENQSWQAPMNESLLS